MVSVPMGGKKNKLKHSIAATEAMVDSTKPPLVAMRRIATRYRKPAVVALTGTNRYRTKVVAATNSSAMETRRMRMKFLRYEDKDL